MTHRNRHRHNRAEPRRRPQPSGSSRAEQRFPASRRPSRRVGATFPRDVPLAARNLPVPSSVRTGERFSRGRRRSLVCRRPPPVVEGSLGARVVVPPWRDQRTRRITSPPGSVQRGAGRGSTKESVGFAWGDHLLERALASWTPDADVERQRFPDCAPLRDHPGARSSLSRGGRSPRRRPKRPAAIGSQTPPDLADRSRSLVSLSDADRAVVPQ
jgi:hypothetical protein